QMVKAADQAKDFYTRYPDDSRAGQAKSKEYELLGMATQLGNTNVLARLETLEQAKLSDSKLSEQERFQIRATAVNRNAAAKLPDRAAAFAELEKGAQGLIKDFPKRPEGYHKLQMVAEQSDPEKGVKLAKQIADSPSAPQEAKDAVKT